MPPERARSSDLDVRPAPGLVRKGWDTANLRRRIGVAIVLLPPLIWVLASGGWPAVALFSLAATLAAFEFYRLAFGKVTARELPALLASAAIPWLPALVPHASAAGVVAALVCVSAFAWGWHVVHQDVTRAAQAPIVVQGVVFCAIGPWCLSTLNAADGGAIWVLVLVSATFLNDTFAFVGGHLFGRHRMLPQVSPGKTWEGLACGAVGSALAAAAAVSLWPHVLRPTDGIVIAAVTASLGPLGDFSKSVLKRSRGVKDAGKLLPGHGGMLDRIDALLLNAPALWAWVEWGR